MLINMERTETDQEERWKLKHWRINWNIPVKWEDWTSDKLWNNNTEVEIRGMVIKAGHRGMLPRKIMQSETVNDEMKSSHKKWRCNPNHIQKKKKKKLKCIETWLKCRYNIQQTLKLWLNDEVHPNDKTTNTRHDAAW